MNPSYPNHFSTLRRIVLTFVCLGLSLTFKAQDVQSWLLPIKSKGLDSLHHLRQSQWEEAQKDSDTLAMAQWAKSLAVDHFQQLNRYEQAIEIGRYASQWAGKAGDQDLQGATLNNLGVFCMTLGKWEDALQAYDKSLFLSRQRNDSLSMAKGLHNIGNLYLKSEQYEAAIPHYLEALAINQKISNHRSIKKNLLSLGLVFSKQNEWKTAKSIYLKALQAASRPILPSTKVLIYTQLGHLYNETYQPDSALYYFQQALQLSQEDQNLEESLQLMHAIGNWHFRQDEFARAAEIWENALDSMGNLASDMAIYLQGGLAMAYKNLDKKELSRKFYQQAIQSSLQWRKEREAATYKLSLAKLEHNEGNYQAARQLLTEILAEPWIEKDAYRKTKAEVELGLVLAKENNWSQARDLLTRSIRPSQSFKNWEDLVAIHSSLSRLALSEKNLEEIKYHAEQRSRWEDSIREGRYSRQLAEVRANYESELQSREIERLEERENLLSVSLTESKERRRVLLILLSTFLLALIVSLVLGFRIRQQSRKIQVQHEELQELNLGKDRMFAIIAHDLASPVSSFEDLNRLFSYYLRKNETKRLQELSEQVDIQSRQLRQMLDNLLQWAMQQMGNYTPRHEASELPSLVKTQLELFEGRLEEKNLSLRLDMPESLEWKGDIKGLRIAMTNLISNGIKFSENSTLRIVLGENEQRVVFMVEDKGSGIEESQLNDIKKGKNLLSRPGSDGERGAGFGLQFVYLWLQQENGELIAESSPGEGSCMGFYLPQKKLQQMSNEPT